MQYTTEEKLQIIQAIENESYKPNEWESEFLDSIRDNDIKLSERQSHCLNRIYEKSSGNDRFVRKQYFG